MVALGEGLEGNWRSRRSFGEVEDAIAMAVMEVLESETSFREDIAIKISYLVA